MQNLPFSIGDRVLVDTRNPNRRGAPVGVHTFPDNSYFDGRVGVITDIYSHYPNFFDSVIVKFDDGQEANRESCFVHEVPQPTTPKKRTRMSPQVRLLRKQLLGGNAVTQRTALMDFGIMALPRRIADLKESGFPVESEMKANPMTGQRYKEYRMKTHFNDGRELIVNGVYKMVDVKFHPFSTSAVERAQGYLVVTGVDESNGDFTCRIGGAPQIHFCNALEDGDFTLKYIGGME